MATSIFLSRPTPHEDGQKAFLAQIQEQLVSRGLAPRTIGWTDYGPHPMSHIRSVMMDCNGFLGVAFRRFRIDRGEDRPSKDFPSDPQRPSRSRGKVRNEWLTTPYLHVEAATAYALGLPVFLIVEGGVILEGALEHGILANDAPVFHCEAGREEPAFDRPDQWRQLLELWAGNVREVVYAKGQPPRLYNR